MNLTTKRLYTSSPSWVVYEIKIPTPKILSVIIQSNGGKGFIWLIFIKTIITTMHTDCKFMQRAYSIGF